MDNNALENEKVNEAIRVAKETAQRARDWALQDKHKARAKEIRDEMEKAFTEHPEETGESYGEHLWFTLTMSGRFIAVSALLTLHGIFPFLFTRTASTQIENIYRIMKSRIPKARREVIDAEFYEI